MSENKNVKKCPCCPRGCDLSSPSCGRGEEYARTGKMLEHNGHGHGNDHWKHHHGGHHGER
jgi:hypothetical protein